MSDTIKQAIASLKTRITSAYAEVFAKGGTLPATQDSANLPAAIASIPSGGGKIKPYILDYTYMWYPQSGFSTDDLGLRDTIDNEYFGKISFGRSLVGRVFLDDLTVTADVAQRSTRQNDVFQLCSYLTEVHMKNYIKNTPGGFVTSFSSFFQDCKYMTFCDISGWEVKGTEDTIYMFLHCTRLTDLRLGSGWRCFLDLSSTGLQHDGILAIFNEIPTVTNSPILMIGNKQSLMTADEIAIATDKGWQIA